MPVLLKNLAIDNVTKTPKYLQVARVIEAQVHAQEISPGSRLPSDRDLAAQMGVTTVTINRGLQELVRKGLIDRKVGSGTFVTGGKVERATRRIGVLCHYPVNQDWYAGRSVAAINRYWSENNGELVCLIKEGPEYQDVVRDYQLDGVIIIAPLLRFKPNLDRLIEYGVPFVLMSGYIKSLEKYCFTVDDMSNASQAVNYLTKLGHRRIGIVPGHYDCPGTFDRMEGFKKAMWEAQLPINFDWCIEWRPLQENYEGPNQIPEIENVLRHEVRPTAFLVSDLSLVSSVYQAASNCGLEIGKDLSVIGFDDFELASYLHPALTTFSQPVERIAYDAAKALDMQLLGTPDFEKDNYSSEFIIRNSCASLV
jgi:DNA-binding LacI/PurR family transcriptional regulator